MKNFYKLIGIVMLVLAMAVLGSCSNKQKIVGTWTDIEGYTWVFSASGILTYDDEEYSYTVFDGERRTELTISEVRYNAFIAVGITDQKYNVEYSKDGKTLRLTGGRNLNGWTVAGPGWSENQLTKR